MRKILFVCTGNICRSPMAEAIMRKRLKEEHLDQKLAVESAGISRGTAGMPPHRGTLKMLKKNKVPYQDLKATPFDPAAYDQYDWIIAMDYDVYYNLIVNADDVQKEKLFMFLSADPDRVGEDVPDPYITGKFKNTYQLIAQGCEYWLELLKQAV